MTILHLFLKLPMLHLHIALACLLQPSILDSLFASSLRRHAVVFWKLLHGHSFLEELVDLLERAVAHFGEEEVEED